VLPQLDIFDTLPHVPACACAHGLHAGLGTVAVSAAIQKANSYDHQGIVLRRSLRRKPLQSLAPRVGHARKRRPERGVRCQKYQAAVAHAR
jgi:hypothetical protein